MKNKKEIKEKESLFKTLTSKELIEICKLNNLTGFSGLKHDQLAKFLSKNLDIPLPEVKKLVCKYQTDKLLCKVRDGADYFLHKRVEIKYKDEELIKAIVGDHSITINNLAKSDFSYLCDEKCHDYQYQVKKGRYPFCKHYAAVIAELIYSGDIDPKKSKINHIEGKVLEELLKIVEGRLKEEGAIFKGREIEENLKKLNTDFLKIAKQDNSLARKKYNDSAENVFEDLVNQAFLLLEFDTITQRSPHGWDILLIAGKAVPPYIVVVECKTSATGVYDQIVKKPDYLVRLKSYCLDMVKDKLIGVYKDYVKYLAIIAPGFPKEVEKYCKQFRNTTGIFLTFWPAGVLLDFVNKFRKNPIVTLKWMEPLFQKERIIEFSDIDNVFQESEKEINELTKRLKEKLKESFSRFSQTSVDASFINLDLIIIESLLKEMIEALEPDLVVTGKKGITGIETINIKHDYYQIWKIILQGLGEQFVEILKEESHSQVKSPELRENIIKLLGVS